MATFVVKSNLNVTVSVIKNVLDDMQFCVCYKYDNIILPSGEYVNITDNCYSL